MNLNLRDSDKNTYFMRQALIQAKEAQSDDEVPVGCVIVHGGKVIGRAHNQVELLKDSTAHAEMIALTQAQSYLASKWLPESSVYVTIEPCFMCAYALVLCRVKELIFAVSEPKTGAFGSIEDINKLPLNHRIKVKPGILEDEAKALIQSFFKKKRINHAVDR